MKKPPPPSGSADPEILSAPRSTTTLRLVSLARRGDGRALDRLFRRLLPDLESWARGKLPHWARRRLDTGDLVQEAFVNAFRHLGRIDLRHRHALRSYLQEAIRNRIRDEIRRAGRVEVSVETLPDAPDSDTSPFAFAERNENSQRYRIALERLTTDEQMLIVGRLELGYSYDQLALAVGRPSADAARVAVRRAVLRLAAEIPTG